MPTIYDMNEYENLRTDIVAEALLDWGVEVIFGLPGDGINGFIEALMNGDGGLTMLMGEFATAV
jgi:thiamine pyrophosphate-dependent acetolactate synthase large subunit-like protein